MDDPRSFFDDSEQRKDDDGRDEEADQDEGGGEKAGEDCRGLEDPQESNGELAFLHNKWL